jgi:hypothetical protein
MSVNNTAVTEQQPLVSYICYKMARPERLGVEMEKETRKTLQFAGLQKLSLFKHEDERSHMASMTFLVIQLFVVTNL